MRVLFACLLVQLTLTLYAPAVCAQSGSNVVVKNDVRLRSSASSSSRAVSSVPRGYPVIMGACRRGWCEVGYMGVRGYLREDQLMRARVPAQSPSMSPSRQRVQQSSDVRPVMSPEPSGPVRPLCKGKYDEAEAFFALGAYSETVGLMAVCASDATFTSEESASAYRMLALSHFYQGDQRASGDAVLELLARNPDYEPTYALDPSDYVTMVRNLKLEMQLLSAADFRCDELVVDAQERYLAANYDGVQSLLYGCLNEPDLAEPVAQRVHRLAALAHMKQDDMDAARATVAALVKHVPEYRADTVQDLPAYVALVDRVREEEKPRRSPWGW